VYVCIVVVRMLCNNIARDYVCALLYRDLFCKGLLCVNLKYLS